ncbi:MAG: rod-binding protein [Lachnospirales bacterium]
MDLSINSLSSLTSANSSITSQYIASNQEAEFKKALEKAMESDTTSEKEDEELKVACKEFESYFLQTVMKEMRKTIPEADEDSFTKKSQGEKIFTDLLDQEYAKMSANQGSFGLATQLYNQMSNKGKTVIEASEIQNYLASEKIETEE